MTEDESVISLCVLKEAIPSLQSSHKVWEKSGADPERQNTGKKNTLRLSKRRQKGTNLDHRVEHT